MLLLVKLLAGGGNLVRGYAARPRGFAAIDPISAMKHAVSIPIYETSCKINWNIGAPFFGLVLSIIFLSVRPV